MIRHFPSFYQVHERQRGARRRRRQGFRNSSSRDVGSGRRSLSQSPSVRTEGQGG